MYRRRNRRKLKGQRRRPPLRSLSLLRSLARRHWLRSRCHRSCRLRPSVGACSSNRGYQHATGYRSASAFSRAAPSPVIEKAPVKPAEQLALLTNKAPETAHAKPAVARPAAPKPLEGFIIQLAFNDKERAQHWAEGMEKKGFAVSLTEAGSEGALRVRLGNFVFRDDAERQLKTSSKRDCTELS